MTTHFINPGLQMPPTNRRRQSKDRGPCSVYPIDQWNGTGDGCTPTNVLDDGFLVCDWMMTGVDSHDTWRLAACHMRKWFHQRHRQT